LTDTDHRLTELEIRLALQDELIDSLNLALNRQQQQLDLQQQQLRRLYDMLQQPQGDSTEGSSLLAQLQQEIPPHY
jgi:SlyX protein